MLEDLQSRCVDHVAREIARARIDYQSGDAHNDWLQKTFEAREEAVVDINNMSNFELLALIEQVAQNA